MVFDWISPEWPAPNRVKAICTTRQGGVSQAPYNSLNLGDHVGDDPQAVARNRQIVAETLKLASEPLWLQQVHGTLVSGMQRSSMQSDSCYPQADASVAFKPNQVCVVMTADCLPVLFCNQAGTKVAAAHAGWKGLCAGVLEATVEKLDCPSQELFVWLGPAIGPEYFEVGDEVREAFMQQASEAEAAFYPGKNKGKWMADLYLLARQRLQKLAISQVFGGGFCTYQDAERFFSYRREAKTGRMASLIWFE